MTTLNCGHTVYLRYVENWPIHSKHEARMTISKELGVTDKTVHNYLARGKDALRAWYSTHGY